jgi:murein DD-endopeptidase MepM/ murein hydrolase activator NlpD
MAAPVVSAALKWAAKNVSTNGTDKASGENPLVKILGTSAVAIMFIIGLCLVLIISLVSSLVGLVMGATNALSVGAGAAVTLSCFADNGTPSTIAVADIPPVALEAYQKAGVTTGVDWSYIAALGKVESDHGRHGDRRLDAQGDVQPTPIQGPQTRYGRAVGPMQFLESTWASVGRDGNFDGTNDPQNIFDAALGAGSYLKIEGAPKDMYGAIFAYNHSDEYVKKVLNQAKLYRSAQNSVEVSGGVTPPIRGTVSVAQANIPNRSTVTGFTTTMRAITSRNPDFITLNEVSARSIAFLQSAAPGYAAYRDPSKAEGDPQGQSMGNVVMYDSDTYKAIDEGRIKIVDDDNTRYQGRDVQWDRFATWVLLERRDDGAIMGVISVHHMTNPGKYGPNKPLRQRLYSQGMDSLLALVGELEKHGPVFVGGDMNSHSDQREAWTAVTKMSGAQFSWYNNSVDYLFFQRNLGITLGTTAFGPTPEPDHRWLWAKFDMNGATAAGTGGPATQADINATLAPPKPGAPKPFTSGPNQQNIDSVVARTQRTNAKGKTKSTNAWVMPLKDGTYSLTARWGQSGGLWSSGYHTGLDFGAPLGTPVFAANAGTVIPRPDQASWAGSNFLTIDHGQVDGKNVVTWYAHLSQKSVVGGQVEAGQNIGTVGSEGNVTGPHLHFEVRVDGKDVDPLTWLNGAGAPSGSVASDNCGPTGSSGVVAGNGAWGGHKNGLIPLSEMCKLSFYPTYLECGAAQAMELLNTAYVKKFNTNVGPVGGYRTYAAQVLCQQEKGNLCATPGTSNHGWGLAADLSGGGINNFGTPQHQWMAQNAEGFGWVLPEWAQQGGTKPEPWHWEYVGTGLKPEKPPKETAS